MDLTALEAGYRAVEHHPGRPPIDVRLLVALWLFATIEGVGSARQLARLCTDHKAYKWLCGGVAVNYHTLADFSTRHTAWLEEQLTWSVAVLRSAGLVELTRVGQDGLRVRASAGAGSFCGADKLEQAYQEARQHWQAVQAQARENPGALTARRQKAQQRAARERLERVEEARRQWRQVEAQREKHKKGDGPQARASTTDPDARRMKMPDGGFRPAYNVQFATALSGLVVLGVAATNAGTDAGQMAPMVAQVKGRHGVTPQEWLVDGSYVSGEDITQVTEQGPTVYVPIKQEAKKLAEGRDPYAKTKGDTPAVAAWRQRMGTAEAKAKYKARGLCEWTNAQVRGHGLTQVLVRGLEKVRAVGLWHGLAVNVRRLLSQCRRGALAEALRRAAGAVRAEVAFGS